MAQLDYAEHYIGKKLDIDYYLKLLIKFDYLLKILLTKEERLLFDFHKKPPLKESKSDKIKKLFNKDKKQGLVEFYKTQKNPKIKRKTSNVVDFLNPIVLDYLRKDTKRTRKLSQISKNLKD